MVVRRVNLFMVRVFGLFTLLARSNAICREEQRA